MAIYLIKNSIESSEKITHPKIKVQATKINSEIKIDIMDNGPGIPKKQINQIFVPLFTTKENGSGIGLFLSRQIMQLHNGSITVKSNPGKETVFTLSFLN
ncbi:MAG: ATP-binding protein [Bacteroidales bacterium]|nr:ATP-binding protein [Bacteroidales bacterium]